MSQLISSSWAICGCQFTLCLSMLGLRIFLKTLPRKSVLVIFSSAGEKKTPTTYVRALRLARGQSRAAPDLLSPPRSRLSAVVRRRRVLISSASYARAITGCTRGMGRDGAGGDSDQGSVAGMWRPARSTLGAIRSGFKST